MRLRPLALLLTDLAADPVAWSIAAALGPETGLRALVLDSSALASAVWTYRISASGLPHTVVQLPTATLVDDELAVVWCRTRGIPLRAFERADPRDRDYAVAEMRATTVGWLHSLGTRVVNTVDGDGLVGPSWTPTRWLVEGARCGLLTAPVTMATSARDVAGWRGAPYDARRPLHGWTDVATESLTVVGPRVFSALPPLVGESCVALAAAAGCRVLEVFFIRQGGDWCMVSADPVPTVRTQTEIRSAAQLMADIARPMLSLTP